MNILILFISILLFLLSIYFIFDSVTLKTRLLAAEKKIKILENQIRRHIFEKEECLGNLQRLEILLKKKEDLGTSNIEKTDLLTSFRDFLQSEPFFQYFFAQTEQTQWLIIVLTFVLIITVSGGFYFWYSGGYLDKHLESLKNIENLNPNLKFNSEHLLKLKTQQEKEHYINEFLDAVWKHVFENDENNK